MVEIGRPNSTVVAPNICTLVGPTKHYRSFDRAGYALGRRGWLVFSVGSHRADDDGLRTTDNDRRIYWHTHRQKIMMSSLVFVVDLIDPNTIDPPRIGRDTRAELEFAAKYRVPILRMSDVWHTPNVLPRAPGYLADRVPDPECPAEWGD